MDGLRSIRLEWFRGVREGGLEGLTDVNILVGRNNSGKTTIAEALSVAAGPDRPDATRVARRERWGSTGRQIANTPEEFQYFRGDPSREISIRLEKADGAQVMQDSVERTWTRRFEGGGSVRPFMHDLTVFFPQDLKNISIETNLWPEVLKSRADKLISTELSRVFRVQLEGVQLLPDGRAMLLFPDYSLPIDTQGDGARAVFRALTLLATMRDTLLILEEPECHQHPGSLGRFAEAICGLARQRSVQLMLTTHSLECVRAFFAGARAVGTEAKLFNLELSDGVLSARSVTAEAAEGLDAAGVDVRELDLYA